VGAGGDFCSREHRNQHQLRRGMDRLAEANEVATLARRRETPKALFAKPPRDLPPRPPRIPRRRALRNPEDRTPGLRWTPKAGRVILLPPAVVLAQPLPDAAPRDVRRDFGRKFAAHAPAALPSGPSAAWKPAGLAAGDVRGLRAIELSAAPRNALRVSSSAGFRLRPPHSPALASAASTGGGIAGLRARAGSRPFALRQESLERRQRPPGVCGCRIFVSAGRPGAPRLARTRSRWNRTGAREL